jgi:choline-sulfatase
MFEGSVAVPMILAGREVPAGEVVATNASLVDCFPTIVEAVGAEFAAEDADLPGTSLWTLAAQPDHARTVFSEYHTIYSPSATYMIRNDRYKYVHYIDHEPLLFDLTEDPDERHDLAGDPRHADARRRCEQELRSILDPEATDQAAKTDQRRRLDAAGGPEVVRAAGVKIPYTPAPAAFGPAPVAARGRAAMLQD